MCQVASKAATEDFTTGVRIVPLPGKPMRARGSLAALFVGGLGVAVLAGPMTCPTCNSAHADGKHDAERISWRLSDLRDALAERQVEPLAQDRAEPPAISKLAPAEPEDNGSSTPPTTAAISSAPGLPSENASPAAPAEPPTGGRKLPDATEEGTDKGSPQAAIAAATVESDPALPPVGDTTHPSENITVVEPEESTLRARHVRIKGRHVPTEQRRVKGLTPANTYSQAPHWAAKMFDSNWQSKAFAYQ